MGPPDQPATASRPTAVYKTHLEIDDVGELVPPSRPPLREFELTQVHDPELNRWFYERVGGEYFWTDRLNWSASQWQRWADRVETWMVTVEGQRGGYFELEPYPPGNLVQLAYFGLLGDFHGYGIGGHVLTAALRRGLEMGPKVAVSTNTLDGPHALPNYRARGMTIVRREQVMV